VSFKVLVIPEDRTYNGYIMQPLIGRMLRKLEEPHARVEVLKEPRVQGYDSAVKAIRSDEVFNRFGNWDLWLFLPDADRARGLTELERELKTNRGVNLLCCAAKPEAEAWLLAGHHDKLTITWQDARMHPSLKESVFLPFLDQHGQPAAPGKGRKDLMRQTLTNYRGLLARCPELKELQDRLSRHFEENPNLR
jgi:hypothetical protein